MLIGTMRVTFIRIKDVWAGKYTLPTCTDILTNKNIVKSMSNKKYCKNYRLNKKYCKKY